MAEIPNMKMTKNEMPTQAPKERAKNFLEVALGYTKEQAIAEALGYTEEQAIDEARRCLNCKHKPCVSGCPVKIDIPAFIAEVAKGNFEEA